MKSPLNASRIRFVTGCAFAALALAVALFVLPDAAQQKLQKQRSSDEATRALETQQKRLAALEQDEQRLGQSRQLLQNLLGSMPNQSAGQLQWALSRRIFELAKQNGVRLQSLKYGAPTREGAKGTDLEILEVEFVATGIYQNLKPFMLGLEDTQQSKLPFAVASAKMDESPEGGRLDVVLRAFRRTGKLLAEGQREGS